VKLRKERKTIWHIFIVLMMMLLIVFLAAPASAVTCYPKYSPWVKVIDSNTIGAKENLVFTYHIHLVASQVTIKVFVGYERTVQNWHRERTKTTKTYCTITHKCELNPPGKIETGTTGVTYGPWRPTSYRVEQIIS
jgi:ABC-type cobalt transport system substrate-binding protein